MTDNEIERKKNILREDRKPLMMESDKMLSTLDHAGGDTSKWDTYRQALRDITKGDLDNPTWPTKPS